MASAMPMHSCVIISLLQFFDGGNIPFKITSQRNYFRRVKTAYRFTLVVAELKFEHKFFITPKPPFVLYCLGGNSMEILVIIKNYEPYKALKELQLTNK